MTQTLSAYTRTVRVAAPLPRVFAAISEPAHLTKWFAEHVEIEPRVGGAFRFWGRFTYDVPLRNNANQKLTRFEPHIGLSFSWIWEGKPGEVHIDLEPAVDPTRETNITIRHERPGGIGDCDSAADFWIVALGNLRSYVATGAPVLLPDLIGRANDPEVRLSIDIDAAPAEVFRALTDPKLLNGWIAKAAKLNLRPGGEYSYGWVFPNTKGVPTIAGPTKIIELIPDKLIVTDWNHEPLGADSQVRWMLELLAAGMTRLTLVHTGFGGAAPSAAADHRGHHLGWARYLVALKETCDPAPATSLTG